MPLWEIKKARTVLSVFPLRGLSFWETPKIILQLTLLALRWQSTHSVRFVASLHSIFQEVPGIRLQLHSAAWTMELCPMLRLSLMMGRTRTGHMIKQTLLYVQLLQIPTVNLYERVAVPIARLDTGNKLLPMGCFPLYA